MNKYTVTIYKTLTYVATDIVEAHNEIDAMRIARARASHDDQDLDYEFYSQDWDAEEAELIDE